MGCCGVKSAPKRDELTPNEFNAHQGIEASLMDAYKQDNKVKKLLLLGSGSSGKSTIFRQLKCVYSTGFDENEINELIPIIRRNCVWGIMTLLKKTQQLYELDEKENSDCYINLDNTLENVLKSISTVVNFSKETFEDYENNFLDYINRNDGDDAPINDYTERRIAEKKAELDQLGNSIKNIWKLNEIQCTYKKRNIYFYSIYDNIDYFFNKIDKVFEWNYTPSAEDIIKVRIRTTGLTHAYYVREQLTFTITDVGGQRNERRKWIHGFEGVTAVIYVAALNHYAAVLFEDESKNGMIESIELFFETCCLKWFKKTEIILFLNKEDLFREYIEKNIPLSVCFNKKNNCIYKKEYDDNSYYPQQLSSNSNSNKNKTNKTNKNKNKINDHDEDNMALNINLNNDDNDDNNHYNNTYIPPQISRDNDNHEYRRKCAIYPKSDLIYSNKNVYDNGKYANKTNDEWLEFIYNDYMYFITEQYLSKNLHPDLKRVFVHVTTATKKNNVEKVFWNVQNMIIRSNLKHGGLV